MSNPHHPKDTPIKRGYFYYLGFGLPTPVFILLEVLTLWAIYHAATTRTVDDYLRYGWIFGIPISILMLKLWIVDWRESKRINTGMKLFILCNIVPGSAAFGAFYYSLAASFFDVAKWLTQQWSQPYFGPVLVSAAVFLIGLGLFWFRIRCRATYGLTEVLVGVSVASFKYVEASAGSQSAAPADPNLLIALLTAGVYLVVRGLDNMQQGLTSASGDPILGPIATWYKNLGAVVIEVKRIDSDNHKQDSQRST